MKKILNHTDTVVAILTGWSLDLRERSLYLSKKEKSEIANEKKLLIKCLFSGKQIIIKKCYIKKGGENNNLTEQKSASRFSITTEHQTHAFLSSCNCRSVYPSRSCSKIKLIKRINSERQAEMPWFLCSLLININALPRCCHRDMRQTESEHILAWLSASLHTDEHFQKGCRWNAHTKL